MMSDVPFHYCPGCSHGIVHRLIAEVIDEMGVLGNTIAVSPVGCSVFLHKYFECDVQQASHGRAPAVATGIKRVLQDRLVFTYQGDGDLIAIGTSELIHAAARSENITTIFINNAIYGMTGGQVAPTSSIGQITLTSPYGRKAEEQGYPIDVCKLVSSIDGAYYVKRCSIDSIANIMDVKKSIKSAFSHQLDGKGFSLVEVLSICPTNWGLSPVKAVGWLKDNMLPNYPVGLYKGDEV